MSPVLQRYLDKVIKDNRTIDARGVMQVNRMIELTMEEVYIHLSVRLANTSQSDFERAATDKMIRGISPEGSDIISDILAKIAPNNTDISSLLKDRPTTNLETGVSADELWARHNAWVLLGDPGAGKTTLLKHFALRNAQDYKTGNGFLPILLPLRLFATEWELHSWTADDAVLNYLGNQGLTELGFELEQEREELLAIFKQALGQGRTLLLFDGLDEQRDANMQRKTVTAIESLHRQYPGNRFLVSSRIIGYDAAPLGSAFNTATLEPFNDEQMEAFFHQWLYAVERQEDIVVDDSTKKRAREKADELIQQIKNNSGIRALATNPLLCTIIGLIRRQGATLPQLRAELYKLCIDTFIFNWELQKRRRPDQQGSLNKEQTQAILEELALHFHEHCPENRASQQTITEIIRDFLVTQEGMTPEDATHKAGQLLSLIRDVSGLLIDRGNNEYGFFHLTFQEYLTARAITRRKRDIDHYLEQHLFEPRWREVIRLAAAHQGMKDEETGSEFIESILRHKHPREEVMHYAFRLGFLCLKEARVELETSDRMFREWIRLYLKQPELQELLLRLLRQSGEKLRYRPDALQPLLAALKNKKAHLRIQAVEALGQIKDPAALPSVLTALKDKNPDVRNTAAQALGQIKDPAAQPALLTAFSDKEASVRTASVLALGQIDTPTTLATLLAALENQDSYVRKGAALALGKIKNTTVLPALMAALKDKDGDVRDCAAIALGEINGPTVLAAMLVAIKDENNLVRNGAAQVLRYLKNPASLPALLDAIKDEDSVARLGAVQALGELKDHASLPALLAMLDDKSNIIRWHALKALGELKLPSTLPALLNALKDKDHIVRLGATQALGNFKDPTTLPILLAEIRDKNHIVRFGIARALGKFKDPSTLPSLLATIEDKDFLVRWGTVQALGELKEPAALPALEAALKDETLTVREEAAKALGQIKAPASLPALLIALKDTDDNVRTTATQSIELIDLGTELCPD